MFASLTSLFDRNTDRRAAESLYDALLVQSRQPTLYTFYRIPDSLDGRFDLLALHLFLVLNRFETGAREHPVIRCLMDRFIDDIDAALRELGASDLRVGKKVQTIAKASMGRLNAYDAAFSPGADPRDLEAALCRNVYRRETPGGMPVAALAAYVRDAAVAISTQDEAAILAGSVAFPPIAGMDEKPPA